MKFAHGTMKAFAASLSLLLMPATAGLAQAGHHAPIAASLMLHDGLAPAQEQASAKDHDGDDAGIVGLWQWHYVSDGVGGVVPKGAVPDSGYKQMHADHNELVLSAERAPLISDVCIGTWKKTGEDTYLVNHFGAGWIPDVPIDQTKNAVLSSFLGPADVREQIKLSEDGNSFTGTFTIDQYANSDVTKPVVHIQGKLYGTRLTTSSKAKPFPF